MDDTGHAKASEDHSSADAPAPVNRPHFSISSILGLDPPRHPRLGHLPVLHSRGRDQHHRRAEEGWHQRSNGEHNLHRRHHTNDDVIDKEESLDDQHENLILHNSSDVEDRQCNYQRNGDQGEMDEDDSHDQYNRNIDHDGLMDDELLDEDELEEDDLDLDDEDAMLMRDHDPNASGFAADSASLSAFVRPTPLRVGDTSIASSAREGNNLSSLLNGETSTLPHQLTSPLSSSPFAPLWYPPWMAAFKPVFGLQGEVPRQLCYVLERAGNTYISDVLGKVSIYTFFLILSN